MKRFITLTMILLFVTITIMNRAEADGTAKANVRATITNDIIKIDSIKKDTIINIE